MLRSAYQYEVYDGELKSEKLRECKRLKRLCLTMCILQGLTEQEPRQDWNNGFPN